MSETDSFIDEVSEEVRRDRLFALFRRYGWIAGLTVVVVVGGAAWFEWKRAEGQAAAERLGDAIMAASALGDGAARSAALGELNPSTAGGTAAMNLLAAAALHEAGDAYGADAKLAAVASDPETPETYRDLAALKRLSLDGAQITDADRAATIDRLSRPGAPFRVLAIEQKALGLVKAGDVDAALAIFQDLRQDAEATPGLTERARQMIIALGGTLDES